jgi:hypothetical protein
MQAERLVPTRLAQRFQKYQKRHSGQKPAFLLQFKTALKL